PGVRLVTGIATRVAEASAGVTLDLGREQLTGRVLIWGDDASSLLSAAGHDAVDTLDRAPATVALALVRRDMILCPEVGTTVVPSDETLPYRITNQSVNAGSHETFARVSCEWHSRFVSPLDRDVE